MRSALLTDRLSQAAKINSCAQIIAVDLIQSRIDLAQKSFGATHGLNTTGVTDLEAALREITGGKGPTVVIDSTRPLLSHPDPAPNPAQPTNIPTATAHIPLLTASLDSLAPRGTLITIGASANPATYNFVYDVTKHMGKGTRILGCIEGDSQPTEFIPRLIEYYRAGKLPLREIARFYEVCRLDSRHCAALFACGLCVNGGFADRGCCRLRISRPRCMICIPGRRSSRF